ncbi:MAG: hypothetical protein GF418_15440 [Chitinivibrionales bacterium]|nr:hypothetical protein [Chitinivibrionales bacterium]MBD3397015.1 hypothetical protein [Chitinivibrionales bacterium]
MYDRTSGPPVPRDERFYTISGPAFDEVWEHRVFGVYGHTSVSYISRIDLLRNKREAGRPKDLADVDELGGNRGP